MILEATACLYIICLLAVNVATDKPIRSMTVPSRSGACGGGGCGLGDGGDETRGGGVVEGGGEGFSQSRLRQTWGRRSRRRRRKRRSDQEGSMLALW